MANKFTYHFEHKSPKNHMNLIRIRAPIDRESSDENLLEIDKFEPEDWSSKFTIEDIDEFQVTFKDSPSLNIVPKSSQNRSILKSRSGNSSKPTWDNPSATNGYRRFVKVSIKTPDEATIFIILSQPKMPEYRINNFSTQKVKFYQQNLKNYSIERFCRPAIDKTIINKFLGIQKKSFFNRSAKVEKMKSFPVPFCWDDQTLHTKKLVLEIDGK